MSFSCIFNNLVIDLETNIELLLEQTSSPKILPSHIHIMLCIKDRNLIYQLYGYIFGIFIECVDISIGIRNPRN